METGLELVVGTGDCEVDAAAVVVGAAGVVGAALVAEADEVDEVLPRLGAGLDDARLLPPLEQPVAATVSVVSTAAPVAKRRPRPEFLRSIPAPVPSPSPAPDCWSEQSTTTHP